jgi:hypothetical protein
MNIEAMSAMIQSMNQPQELCPEAKQLLSDSAKRQDEERREVLKNFGEGAVLGIPLGIVLF